MEELFQAIEALNISKVEELLVNGANPNTINPIYYNYPHLEYQPYSPLRLIVFYLSDALLEEEDYEKLYKLTVILLKHGADPKKAIELAELRYGKVDLTHESPANKVLNELYKAV